ncbi:MAG: ABC transporter substrate-binding protein [Lachnoclostridium sp.]|jgi:NitT/TauT family transport system substrate-binding protein|nr:ABC transporter substrate-binding protein [Lachnoclostridium sp.]
MKRLQKLVSLMIMLGMIISLTACASDESSTSQDTGSSDTTTQTEEKTALRIGYFPNITHAQALVAKDQKKVETAVGDGVEVTWTSFNAGPAEIEALFAGEIDLGYIGPIPAITSNIQSSGDVSIVSNATNGGAVLVTRKDLVLDSPADLAGKKVAIPQIGNTQHVNLLKILSENELRPDTDGGDVEVKAVENSNVQQLMDAGEIDAALVPEPWGTVLEKEIGANVLLDYKDVWMEGDYSVAVVICSKDFKEAHPDIVKKFLAAHKEATLFINDNAEEAKSIINKQIEETSGKAIAPEVLDSAFSRLVVTDTINEESITQFAEISKQEGLIDDLPGENLIDTSFAE